LWPIESYLEVSFEPFGLDVEGFASTCYDCVWLFGCMARGRNMCKKVVYFAIRDDDTCYFTQPAQLESCYEGIWDTCPVSLSIVPFHACTKSGAVPKKYWEGSKVFPLERNRELVQFLRDGIERGRICATLHGYHHRDEFDGYEFVAGDDLAGKVLEGKRYLEDLLGQPIGAFVPPHNSLGRDGYDAVRRAGMDVSGIQSFRPSVRGWDPRVFAMGMRERLYMRWQGCRRPWPLVFPDGHREVPYCALTPSVCPEDVLDAFQDVCQTGGVFCVATHYWEFDKPSKQGSKTRIIRETLARLWDRVLVRAEQVEFRTLDGLFDVKPSEVRDTFGGGAR